LVALLALAVVAPLLFHRALRSAHR
jgi:hypothetical protein